MKSGQIQSTLQVSVLHGDLNHTNHPILLGHYEGDTIAGAERVVDKMVEGALSQRYHLGRYPGRNGTAAVALAPSNEIQQSLDVQHGAIVIGLGKWGELTPSALTQAVSQGITEYCLHVHQCRGATDSSKAAVGLTINSLLIGSNTSANIAVEDSVNAIVRGVVLANRALAQRPNKSQGLMLPRVAHVQFIERFLDVAVDAAKSAHRVAKRIVLEFQTVVQVERYLKKGSGGLTRLVPSSTRGYWRRWTISAIRNDPPPPSVGLPPVLKERLRTLLQEEPTKDPQVYNALLDLALTTRELTAPRPHKLRFLALSDRARAEATVQDNQPDLIAQLIQRSIRTETFNQDIAKTLFELLIPLDLKESLRSLENVVFILDEVTANYPWELMIDTEKPLCVRAGVIRQLQTLDGETHARDSTTRHAFVVGNPLTPPQYRDLSGAMEEATLVADMLEKANYRAEFSRTRLGASEVFKQLFARSYRIIHIAGHGQYSEADNGQVGAKVGVVLSDGLFLTAAEIATLDPIPELVFLNCCHLGQMGGTASNKMAASIASELIRKGVRAVVAAGWPVQDDAALCFAGSFYRELLAGRTFGLALKQARRQTWEEFPSSNTWGAYQAYGDPDFCLNRTDGLSAAGEEDVKVAAEEVLLQLDGLSQQLNHADEAKVRAALNQVEQLCAEDWLKQGSIQERLGAAYAGAGLFKEAIPYYQQAVENKDIANPATLRVVEQWINVAVRCGEKDGNKVMIQEAIDKGRHLLALAKTSERLSLMGGAQKKLAQLETDAAQIRVHLAQAAADYRAAAEQRQREGIDDPYPILNAVVIEVLLGKEDADREAALSRCEALVQARFKETRSVWDAITIADVALIRAIISRSLPQERDNIIEKYRAAFTESSATQREQDSALTKTRFIREILRKVPQADRDTVMSAVKSLDWILKHLQPRSQPAEASVGHTSATSTGLSRQRYPATSSVERRGRKKAIQEKSGRRATRRKRQPGTSRPSLS